MQWDYFEPKPSDYCKSASKRYVDARDDTVLKTALAKVTELNRENQADWSETDTRKASYIKNKPDIAAMSAQPDWLEDNTTAYSYIRNKPTLSAAALSGSYNDLEDKPTIPTVPTNVSDFNNDANYQSGSEVSSAIGTALANYSPTSSLATVATTGDYNDLTNAPVIPSGITLYNATGQNEDGAMTQKATTDALTSRVDTGTFNSTVANLQTQIDTVSASSDVKDIVGTKLELDNYDTTSLNNNDIIKVLSDSSQSDATTYYKWNSSTSAFVLIGSEGPYYTRSETDTLLNAKADSTGLASVATSGDYTDLLNKPTIPVITMQTTDPGVGAPLAANNFIAVYEA